MSETTDDRLTRSIAVPAWMVYGATALIVVLSGGPVGQLVLVSHHVYELQRADTEIVARIGDNEKDIAGMRVKEADLVAMVNSLRGEVSGGIKDVTSELQAVQRKVDVLTARMP